eukprot:1067003-Pelagomonas_calceolata.AAC.1
MPSKIMLLAPSWRLLFRFVNLFVRISGKRPYVSLWLGKTYVVLAGMYAGSSVGTEYNKVGKEFASDLQVWHMSYLKSMLGVKRTTTNWAVLRECGHESLQFYWFRPVAKMCNSTL